jgi:DNA processing protein
MGVLSDSERRAWLRLARTEHVGPVTFQSLIARFGSASAALEELPRLAQRGGGKNFVLADERDCNRELEALAKLDGRMIASREADYPRGLAALDAPPPLISVLGHPHLLQKDMVAIVGARNASALARKFADILSRELGFAGLVVVRGWRAGSTRPPTKRRWRWVLPPWWPAASTSSIRPRMKNSMPRSRTSA